MRQVVILGAGYDTRAVRFAAPGTTFFEVDLAATQHDKRKRLAVSGLQPQVSYVEADLEDSDLGERLRCAGHDETMPSLWICECVAMFLSTTAIERMLATLRVRSAPQSMLAMNIVVDDASMGSIVRRLAAVRAMVTSAPLGERVRQPLTEEWVSRAVEGSGWEVRAAYDPRQLHARYLSEILPPPTLSRLTAVAHGEQALRSLVLGVPAP